MIRSARCSARSDFVIVRRFFGVELGFAEHGFGLFAGHDLRAAEDDDRGIDLMFAEQRFGLQQLELHPQRAVFLAAEEIDIELGELIAGRLEDRQPVGGNRIARSAAFAGLRRVWISSFGGSIAVELSARRQARFCAWDRLIAGTQASLVCG